jgi:2'-5' RNA ligase
MRTFIAIELDQKIKTILSSHIKKLETSGAKVRWVKPQGMHLTLKFLGEVPEARIPEIKKVLARLAKDYGSFQLILKGTGTFPPPPRTPRVVWIGIEQTESLQHIQTRVENELHKIRFPKEKRKFHPHLTLGRVKNPMNIQPLLEMLNLHNQTDFGTMSVNKLTFFRSMLKPSGAEYTVLSEAYLE